MINYKKFKGVGVVGYGSYIPPLRLKVEQIAAAHGINPEPIRKSLKLSEKAVCDWDEDATTMAYQAAAVAIETAKVSPLKIGAIYIGSESHPYAVKPTATIVGEALRVGNEYMAADLEFACKAGTAALQIVAAELAAGMIDYGLAVGTDRAQANPGDILEYSAGAGAAAFLLGRRKILAKITGSFSYTSDTADFWRRSGQKYPAHAGRFTGEPAYFKHIFGVTERFFQLSRTKALDYDYAVLHMPNGKFPVKAAEKLGFCRKQFETGLIVEEIGNPYSASSLLGLTRVLDKARAGKKILLVAYGSGAGADAISLETTDWLAKRRFGRKTGSGSVRQLSYGEYRTLYG